MSNENIWKAVHLLMEQLGYEFEKTINDMKNERIIFVQARKSEVKE